MSIISKRTLFLELSEPLAQRPSYTVMYIYTSTSTRTSAATALTIYSSFSKTESVERELAWSSRHSKMENVVWVTLKTGIQQNDIIYLGFPLSVNNNLSIPVEQINQSRISNISHDNSHSYPGLFTQWNMIALSWSSPYTSKSMSVSMKWTSMTFNLQSEIWYPNVHFSGNVWQLFQWFQTMFIRGNQTFIAVIIVVSTTCSLEVIRHEVGSKI